MRWISSSEARVVRSSAQVPSPAETASSSVMIARVPLNQERVVRRGHLAARP